MIEAQLRRCRNILFGHHHHSERKWGIFHFQSCMWSSDMIKLLQIVFHPVTNEATTIHYVYHDIFWESVFNNSKGLVHQKFTSTMSAMFSWVILLMSPFIAAIRAFAINIVQLIGIGSTTIPFGDAKSLHPRNVTVPFTRRIQTNDGSLWNVPCVKGY